MTPSRQPGQRVISRFILKRMIGVGGMGEVWLARDEHLDRDIALKFLSRAMLHDGNAVERLKRETKHNLKLTHPHIVRIHDFVQDDTDAAISMEYVEGWSLWSMKVNRPHQCFTVAEIEPWIRQLGSALEYAHNTAGVVHRDLKPANLLIDSREQLKVSDFGIARNLNGITGQMTAALPPLGTIGYMSPQQALGSAPSVLDDVYSLGATIYDLLTGTPPFYKGEVMAQLQQLAPPTMTERLHEVGMEEPPAIPLEWEQTIAACLEKDPKRRPPNIASVLESLFAPPTHVAHDHSPQPVRPRKRMVMAGSFIAIIALVGGLAWARFYPARQAQPGNIANPIGNGDEQVIASRIFTGADDFVVDVFHNGNRVPASRRQMSAEQFGATGERIDIVVRENDWIVFNVVNNRLRWNAAYYFGAAGITTNGSIGFTSRESEDWSVCEDPGLVSRFIAERDFHATNLARRIEKPWAGGDAMIKAHVKKWEGHAIWGSPTNRNIWLKIRVPRRTA